MAILDLEHFGRETNLLLSGWWAYSSGSISADGAGPFDYGRYIQNPDGQGRSIPATSVLWFQAHIYVGSTPNGVTMIRLEDSLAGTQQITFTVLADGRMEVRRGTGTTLAASDPGVFSLNTWHFIQIRALIANSGGNVQVWLNGRKHIDVTGDTQNTANAHVNYWALGWGGGPQARYANILIYDESGAAPNARTPETRIYADLPNAAGGSSGWTPSAGSNYQCVDEQPNDGDSTYVSAAAAGLDDAYACPASVPGGSTVYAVGVEFDARKDDAGTNDIDGLVRSGGANYPSGSTSPLTTTYQRFRRIWATDPATGAAWTVSGANAAQPGVRRAA